MARQRSTKAVLSLPSSTETNLISVNVLVDNTFVLGTTETLDTDTVSVTLTGSGRVVLAQRDEVMRAAAAKRELTYDEKHKARAKLVAKKAARLENKRAVAAEQAATAAKIDQTFVCRICQQRCLTERHLAVRQKTNRHCIAARAKLVSAAGTAGEDARPVRAVGGPAVGGAVAAADAAGAAAAGTVGGELSEMNGRKVVRLYNINQLSRPLPVHERRLRRPARGGVQPTRAACAPPPAKASAMPASCANGAKLPSTPPSFFNMESCSKNDSMPAAEVLSGSSPNSSSSLSL